MCICRLKRELAKFGAAFLCLSVFCFLTSCAFTREEEVLLECKDAKELTKLLYASNDRNRYYNYGFPFKEGNEETILMTGYGQVDSPIFSTLEQVQKYFLEIYTEDYCEKHWFWTGESPRWKEMDGILFQSYADGMYFPVTEENLEISTVLYESDDEIVAYIYFDSQIDDTKFVTEYTIVRTEEGLRIAS